MNKRLYTKTNQIISHKSGRFEHGFYWIFDDKRTVGYPIYNIERIEEDIPFNINKLAPVDYMDV